MRSADLAALMQRTEGVEITSYLVADPAAARSGGVRVSHAGGLISWTMRSTDNGFLNRALGFGTLSEATPAVPDRLERRFAAAGRPSRIAVAQGPTPRGALRLLERRGYAPEEGTEEHIYCYDRRRLPTVRAIDGLTLERVRPEGATEYARIAFQSFTERGPWFRGIVEALVRRRARGRALSAFLGRVDGVAAATGMLFDVRPVAGLGNASVLPRFRGRGIQSAMIVHRMRAGWERGLRIFFGQTQNPASAHNLEDLGWRLLYTEVDWVRLP
ncbi:MAG: GNAT family N-acetyltransferase [Candidatus Limnocylindria bacterium]